MQKNTLKPKTELKKRKLVGRGGKRGKTAGRGTKGQSARAGNKKRPELRDIIKKLPKLRGYKFNSINNHIVSVTLNQIEKVIENGQKITPAVLVDRGVINTRKGKVPEVKILATGKITKKANFQKFQVSAAAKAAIESVGGTVK
jgi:large subunit ribosomal protein L15